MNILKAVALLIVVLMFANAQVSTIDTVPQCVLSNEDRERIRAMLLDTTDQFFKNHVLRLVEVYLKDTSEAPVRARAGLAVGLDAYNRARRDSLKWNPPLCQ